MAKKSKKDTIVTINFKGVEAGGGAPAEGKYEVEVAACSKEVGEESGQPYLAFEYKIIGPGKKKGKLFDNCSLTEQSLWRVKGILETLGVEIPDDETDIDTEELIGLTMGVEVTHEVYNKKKYARITDWFEVGSEGIEEDEDEEKPAKSRKAPKDEDEEPKKKDKKKKKPSMTSDEVLEMNEDGLQETIEEHSLDVDLEEYNTTRRKRAAVIEALTEAGIIEEEEDGEEEK